MHQRGRREAKGKIQNILSLSPKETNQGTKGVSGKTGTSPIPQGHFRVSSLVADEKRQRSIFFCGLTWETLRSMLVTHMNIELFQMKSTIQYRWKLTICRLFSTRFDPMIPRNDPKPSCKATWQTYGKVISLLMQWMGFRTTNKVWYDTCSCYTDTCSIRVFLPPFVHLSL